MKTVQLVQLNNNYGDQVYLPYSVGMLKAYLDQYEDITTQFLFKDFIFLRENLEIMLQKIGHTDILGISCYVWNWELSTRLANAVRQQNPKCLIILGGPQVPNHCDGFFEKHPYIDMLCHGEGEITFHDIFSRIAKGDELKDIPGTSYYDRTSKSIDQ